MKNLLLTVTLLFIGLISSAQFTEVHVQASGLTCAMCAKAVFKNLEALPFAEKIDTDLNNSVFVIKVKPNATVNPDQIAKKVEEAGFAVAALSLKGNFSDLNLSSDHHFSFGGQAFHFLGKENKVLNGSSMLVLVDKSFVPEKEYKKFSKATEMECFKTGTAAGCCKKEGITTNARIYHVIT